MHNNIKAFERHAEEYDLWFEKNSFTYESELMLLNKIVPKSGKGLEIGVGTGRFSSALGIKLGIDPAFNMLLIAKKRGIKIFTAKAEALPFKDNSFDFLMMVTVLCFLPYPLTALREAKRVIKNKGYIIIGMIDKENVLGQLYESKKKESKFYGCAKFYSVKNVLSWLRELKFHVLNIYQTIFQVPEFIKRAEPIKEG